ncbi:hypothetical protein B0H19DRAFT_902444, partial [Mycena capillaripes]
ILRQAAANAFHDAAEIYPQPQCPPQTRRKILEELLGWSCGSEPNTSHLWLDDESVSKKRVLGKSTCSLEAENCLGASFFFKRGHVSRGNGNKLFPTIAYQLAGHLPEIPKAVAKDPTILDRSLMVQLQKLIIEPGQHSSPRRTMVVVIDGLDECEGKDIQQEILRSIDIAIQKGLPLRFFIASRPEPHISGIFGSTGLAGSHCPVNIQRLFDEVRLYLKNNFAKICQKHEETMAMVSQPWPSPADLEHLVQKSSGYFIYASTVIRFIDDKNFQPTERHKVIMGIPAESPEDESPFGALDQLYIQILS